MATRGTVSVELETGVIRSIYNHWESSPDKLGATLKTHYTELSKVKELIGFGDTSIIREHVNSTSVNHSFDFPETGVCVFYGRDRGENDTNFSEYDSVKSYLKHCNFQDYNYIFRENTWWLMKNNRFVNLADI